MKIAIIIPFYNEEQNLLFFLNEWNEFLKYLDKKKYKIDFFFINDGSTDYSVEIIKNNSNKLNFKIINKENSGHGDSCKYGYDLITNKNYDYLLQIDSDNQCNPKYLINFLNIAKKKNESFIFGYRKRREDGYIRFLTSKLLSLSIFCKKLQFIKDANTPYRLMKTSNLKKILNIISKKKKYKNVALFNCILTYEIQKKYNIKWIDINFRKRVYGSSKFGALKMLKIYINLISII